MKERLKQDLDRVFQTAPDTQKNRELREEILANLYDKYDACLESGMSPEEAYRDTVGGIGDLSALFEKEVKTEPLLVPLYDEAAKKRKKQIHDFGLAAAVMLYNLAVLPLILWDSVWMVACMFLMVAAATGILIYLSGTESILIDGSMPESEREALRKRRSLRAGILAGSVMLYILCVCPVILIPEGRIGAPLMFSMIAIATAAIILRGTMLSLPIKELNETEPMAKETEKKKEKKTPLGIFFSILSGVYWFAVITAYFAYSFLTERWTISWLIFLCAAFLYAIVHGIWQLVTGQKRGGAIVKIVICSILLFTVFSPSLLVEDGNFSISLGGLSHLTYDESDYSVGEALLSPEDQIVNLDVEWVSGSVNVVYWNENYVSLKEEASETLSEKDQLRWRLENGYLSIKFRAPEVIMLESAPAKNLTVYLPMGTSLERMTVDSVSGAIHAEGIRAESVSLNTVSGEIRVVGCDLRDLDVGTVSGAMELEIGVTPMELDMDSVSGSAYLTLPADLSGYDIEFETLSGDLTLPEGAKHHEDGATYGDRSTEINFDSVSGSLTVRLAKTQS